MRSYTFECEKCGEFTVWYGHGVTPAQVMRCPGCHARAERRPSAPNFIVRGQPATITKKGALPIVPGISDVWGRSAEQLERDHAKFIKSKAKVARETKRARHGTKRRDGEVRHVGAIPMHKYIAYRREVGGKQCAEEGIVETAKKLDGYFGDG